MPVSSPSLVNPPQPSTNALAKALGVKAWTFDPRFPTSTVQSSSGTMHGAGIWLAAGDTISHLDVFVTVAGVSVTDAWLFLLDSGFNLVAQTADTPGIVTGSTGWQGGDLTTPYAVGADGIFYLCDLCVGGTQPSLATSGSLVNGNIIDLPTGWLSFVQAGLSSPPSPATPAISTGGMRALIAR